MTPGTGRRLRRNLLIYAGLAPFVVVAVFPVYWMAVTAFKEEADLYRMDLVPFWFHMAPTLKNFHILLNHSYFPVWFVNTMLLSVCLVAITLATAVPAGYALSRLRLPGAGNLGISMFMTYLVPPIIIFLPLARIVGTLGLFDSWWALVVVYPTFTIPFCTWILTGFFKTLPREIEEAAWVDGCGLIGGVLRVVLPLTRPGIVITAIFAFTLAMQESLYAVVYVAPRDQTTVTVGVATALIRGDVYYWGALMAAGLIVGLPVAILYSAFLDHFIRGLTASGAS
ncbi:MAG: sugar ABC transporter permease [Candidatus Rokuibacteriota bacterium]|jgi:multiple sugar transport system permease protein|nr:MAG: sugar ABC transporter permease [Candidatus Rokubacteria bacterium]PYO12607.1 MAG: sugar ABC transporter permease [Candidatus Rokubacteria bacterium]